MYIRVERATRQPDGTVKVEFFNSFRNEEDLLRTMPARLVDHDGNPINPEIIFHFYDANSDAEIEDPRPYKQDDSVRLCSPGAADPKRLDDMRQDVHRAVHARRSRRRQTTGQIMLF